MQAGSDFIPGAGVTPNCLSWFSKACNLLCKEVNWAFKSSTPLPPLVPLWQQEV